ncbi:MAG TPA: elongation factor P-like protein YeiP, partial [Alcanivorax sp.]|nr:elongation factor P-like protein YeiP [Alcanivorax sp.]HBT06752.1 elongation factor P-like protein YeiP [Alcanivorax sp.]HCQ37351.1 elongation factor P-like protein YeiP [Alcanivorax sp.]
MTRASDLKKSDVIEHNGSLFVIRQIEVNSPSARGAATLYRVRAAAVGGGPKFEERYKGDEDVPTVELLRRPVHFSYVDGDDHVFMDDEDFSQYPLKAEDIRDELPFITEGCDGLLALKVGDSVIGLELPLSVVLTITET